MMTGDVCGCVRVYVCARARAGVCVCLCVCDSEMEVYHAVEQTVLKYSL
jgi:hypothetical protein